MLDEVLATLMLVLESHWTTETIRHLATFLTATLCQSHAVFLLVAKLTRRNRRFCGRSGFSSRFTNSLRFVRPRRWPDRQRAVYVCSAGTRVAPRCPPLRRQIRRARQIRQSRHDEMDPPLPPRQDRPSARCRLRPPNPRQATASRTDLRNEILCRLLLSSSRRTPSAPLELPADPSRSIRPAP